MAARPSSLAVEAFDPFFRLNGAARSCNVDREIIRASRWHAVPHSTGRWHGSQSLRASASAPVRRRGARPAPATTSTPSPSRCSSSIEDEEALNGPFSRDLVDLLTSLGLAYQEHDRHDLASSCSTAPLYLKRVNDGLFGLDQAALVRRLVDSELAMGRVSFAAELQDRLLELARRNPADPRAAPILRDAAERQVEYYERYLRGDIPASQRRGSMQQVAGASLRRARRFYREAIWALARNGAEHPAELRQLEQGLTRTYYLEASRRRRSYPTTRRRAVRARPRELCAARRIHARGSPSAVDYARALVELADWSLLFSRNGTAVKRYAEAHALLVANGACSGGIDRAAVSGRYAGIPADVRVDAVRWSGRPSAGYVDVDFEVGKYGQPRDVTIVATAGDAAAATSKELAVAINRGRFRPSPLAEENWTGYRLRYSLADGSLTPRL